LGQQKIKVLVGGETGKKVSYTIEDIVEDDGKVLFKIKINKAGKIVDRKMVVDPEGYDETGDFAKELEKEISNYIVKSNPKYLTKNNTKFEFSH